MKYNLLFISLIYSSFVVVSCARIDNDTIKKSWWKYGSGYRICDRLDFDNNNLKGDTIYLNNKPIAIVLSCSKGLFRNTADLEIKNLTTGETGIYHEK